MKKQLALALLLATASSAAAAADGLSYSYVEVGASQSKVELPTVDANFSVDDIKANGGYLRGSVALGDAFHLFGGYRQGDDDVAVRFRNVKIGETNIDLAQYEIGFGYHHTLSERVDWTGELSYVGTDVDVEGGGDFDRADDFRASVGLRGKLARNFEGWVKANYTDGDAYDSEFSGTIGAQIKFNHIWGIVGEAEFGDTHNQLSLGVRASF
ncbi:outer membrane beta-barrel protein [Lysobacter capsici]|uniref:outer membrane beta-barrel protein n=1 Tax=Lysobacter capsici TaxID=435897 RepID=UPI001C000CFF|nr:outer membrane beta-barrel protein [Lysobacter capsici]MBW8807532.1 outer membrane beta-barrel protein [Lysobacter sp.]QWF15681.1 outer membrane beta-barrel protein [Lysobacter capsici]